MGYLQFMGKDGYWRQISDDGEIIYLEVCDVCNNPRPTGELINVGESNDNGAIWECTQCHGINKS